MKCERPSSSSVVLLLLLLLFMALVMAWGLEPETRSLPLSGSGLGNLQSSIPITESKAIELPPEFWQSWEIFKLEFQGFSLSLETFLDQVEAFGISFEELPAFLTHLTESYKASETARLEEREAADASILELERSRKAWKTATVSLGILSAILAILAAL